MKEYTELLNKIKVPNIGFGTWQTPDGDTAVNAVKTALECGYRHIDTAAAYGNETSVGKAIKESGINRQELFITSKLWNKHRGYATTKVAFEESLDKLELDYLDLYLIHWPASFQQYDNWKEINQETWQAMEELYKAGRIKSIGVSNFRQHHLKALFETCEIKPMVDQIEFHPGFMQEETLEFCRHEGIAVEAWSPLGSGRMLFDERLKRIAEGYGKSVAQLCIRWVLQKDVIVLPKSVTPSRIKENMQVLDFEISSQDMQTINAMPYFGGSGLDPDKVTF